ncbi:MAG: sugar phosphate isomerase/epimerase [Planctomycetaceae bacterium]|nr:sugar phosphate isomerase/epimerase [Planctomycetaceae bacterium]
MSDQLSRRGFVKSVGYSSAAAAALTGVGSSIAMAAGDDAQPASSLTAEKIRIGTLVPAGAPGGPANYIRQILPRGFESFSITFGGQVGDVDLKRMAAEIKEVLGPSGAVISSIGIYANPLVNEAVRKDWQRLIDAAGLFGATIVTGFTGRIVDKPVPESIPRFAEVFAPLAKQAADKGVRLAFENCDMGGNWLRGDWNIAHNPTAWEMMFNAVPVENLGLQWEPAHQMCNLIDPLPQLRKYVKRVFHLHGKDASIQWDVIREHGIGGSHPFAFHRTPSFGDCNWTDVISDLRAGNFVGSIDIEGWHDPVYRGDLEMTGQVAALNYLKRCRGGSIVANPK